VQVKCRTYVLDGNTASYRGPSEYLPYNGHAPDARNGRGRAVYVDDPQYAGERSMDVGTVDGDRSPVILSDDGPVTINFKTSRPAEIGPGRHCSPIVVTSRGRVTVNYYDDRSSADAPTPEADVGSGGPGKRILSVRFGPNCVCVG